MRFSMKTSNIILLILSILSLICLIYILFQVNTNIVEALNIDRSNFMTIDYLMGFSHLFLLLFHCYAIIHIFAHFRRFSDYRVFKTMLLLLGVISLFAMGGEKVMIDEIAREYRLGLDISELYILNLAYIINAAFTILLFLLVLKTFRLVHHKDAHDRLIEEVVFTITQVMGIIAGVIGLVFTFHFIVIVGNQMPVDKLWVLIPFYMLFLVPYALAVLYWVSLKRKQHIHDWYDEKQLQDILKSSLITLILSVPGLGLFTCITLPSRFYIIPLHLFFIMLVFSGLVLYFFKIEDCVNTDHLPD